MRPLPLRTLDSAVCSPVEVAMRLTRRLRQKGSGARGQLLSPFYLDLNREYGKSVFLAGSGRSGTTWVSDIINYRNDYRLIFEPFNPDRVDICKHFNHKQYLRPDDRREEFLGPARTILSGSIRSRWTDRFHRKVVARRRVIKDIRANLLLGWMRANFPRMPIILLLRHPCAVLSSRLRLGWRDNLDETMEQQDLIEDFLHPFEAEIRTARTAFERHLFLWCIDNYVPLKQLSPGEVHLLFYENLLANPEDEIRRLFAYLDVEFDERVLDVMRCPSSLSLQDDMPERRTAGEWRRLLSRAQIERAVEILGLFGLDSIYDEEPMPHSEEARDLMKAGRTRANRQK